MNRTPLALGIGYIVPCKKPLAAEEFLHEFCEAKRDRGYTLRYGAANDRFEIWLQHDSMTAIETAISALKDKGFVDSKPIRRW